MSELLFLLVIFTIIGHAHINYKLAQIIETMAALDDKISALQTEVTNNTTVIGSAETLINGFAAQLAAAIAAALAAGATDAQLQSLTDLNTTLTANDTALAAAVAANTPPPPPQTP